jgi:hypothetical protein
MKATSHEVVFFMFLYSEVELNALHSSPNIIQVIKSRRMRWAGHVARVRKKRAAYRILMRRPEGRRPLGRPRRRWEDNIKMDLQEVGWGAVKDVGLRPSACWDRGFGSHRGHGFLSLVQCLCCQVEISATCRSLVQRSPTDCGVCLNVIK